MVNSQHLVVGIQQLVVGVSMIWGEGLDAPGASERATRCMSRAPPTPDGWSEVKSPVLRSTFGVIPCFVVHIRHLGAGFMAEGCGCSL